MFCFLYNIWNHSCSIDFVLPLLKVPENNVCLVYWYIEPYLTCSKDTTHLLNERMISLAAIYRWQSFLPTASPPQPSIPVCLIKNITKMSKELLVQGFSHQGHFPQMPIVSCDLELNSDSLIENECFIFEGNIKCIYV